MWQDILTSILTSGVITGIFVAILNKAIENKFEMKLEAYKDKLKAESDKELLQLTKDLELKASERNIKLTALFDKQAETILTVYGNLLSLKDAVRLYSMSPSTSQMQAIHEIRQKLFTHFYSNKPYIPKDTAAKIVAFAQELVNAGIQFELVVNRPTLPMPQQEERAKEVFEKMFKEMPSLFIALEDDFQKILGVSLK